MQNNNIFYKFLDFQQAIYKILSNKIQNTNKNKDNFKILGVDFGTKKIGYAVGDLNIKIAFPKEVSIGNWQDLKLCSSDILSKIEKYNCNAVVMGFPLKNDGTLHKNCHIILNIAKIISQFVPILLFDERFTTKMTNSYYEYEKNKNNCNKNKKSKSQQDKYDDANSASIILMDVLQQF